MTINPKIFDILAYPVRTEKAFAQHETSKYAFFVRDDINKNQVKTAIEKIFDKKVEKVNIVAGRTKTKGARKGRLGKKKIMKKAIVTLEKGAKLDEVFGS